MNRESLNFLMARTRSVHNRNTCNAKLMPTNVPTLRRWFSIENGATSGTSGFRATPRFANQRLKSPSCNLNKFADQPGSFLPADNDAIADGNRTG